MSRFYSDLGSLRHETHGVMGGDENFLLMVEVACMQPLQHGAAKAPLVDCAYD